MIFEGAFVGTFWDVLDVGHKMKNTNQMGKKKLKIRKRDSNGKVDNCRLRRSCRFPSAKDE